MVGTPGCAGILPVKLSPEKLKKPESLIMMFHLQLMKEERMNTKLNRRWHMAANSWRTIQASLIIIFGLMVLNLMVAANGLAHEGSMTGPGTRMKVSGVVSKVKGNVITVKTPWGRMNITSVSGPANLQVGEEVVMQVNEENIVIDVHRKGEEEHDHRFVVGKLIYAGKTKDQIKLWTPEGEQTFPLERMEIKTKPIEEGTLVIVELNEAGSVIDLRENPTVEMSFEEHPHTAVGHHITVNGVVSKIQSGVVYVKSPVGQYTISAKSAPADAEVGDEVTLWLNEGNMVIDHHGKDKNVKGAHRLIFGKLIYAGLTKKEIKLWTPEGEQVFPLERMEIKTKPIPEGSPVVVELNEEGTVISLRMNE